MVSTLVKKIVCFFLFQLRSEIDEKNLSKQYVRSVIKRQCWDDMMTKGRSIKAFYSSTEVTNYPMRERSKQELEKLAFVSQQRKFEISEEQARKDILDSNTAGNPALIGLYEIKDLWKMCNCK